MLLVYIPLLIIAGILLYISQRIKSNVGKWILRIIGTLIILYVAIIFLWAAGGF